jgi:hypothetical protein
MFGAEASVPALAALNRGLGPPLTKWGRNQSENNRIRLFLRKETMSKNDTRTTAPGVGAETSVPNTEELIDQLTSIDVPEDGFENPTPEQTFANNHKELSNLWNKHYREQFTLGELLCQQHDYLAAKGPGGQWAAYCKRIGIPLSTANDYRNAYTGAMVDTPKEAHAALAATRVNLFGAKAKAALPQFNAEVTNIIKQFEADGAPPETLKMVGVNTLDDALKMVANSFKGRVREAKTKTAKPITAKQIFTALKDFVDAVRKCSADERSKVTSEVGENDQLREIYLSLFNLTVSYTLTRGPAPIYEFVDGKLTVREVAGKQ